MLKISEFSRLTKVPVKTLRYYDEIGLFKAAHVDRFTGYRYYSAHQLPRLHRIVALKELGFSLEQIKNVLDEGLTAEQIRGMLRLKRAELQRQIEHDQARLNYIEVKIQQIEEEQKMSEYDVIVKSVEAFPVASIRDVAPTMQEIGPTLNRIFDELMAYIESHNGRYSEKPEHCGVTLYHDEEMQESEFHVEAAQGIVGTLNPSPRVNVYTLPALELAASVVHRGSFVSMGKAYDALTRWIDANGYEIIGPMREINLEYERHGDPNKYVTEIQAPIRKRG